MQTAHNQFENQIPEQPIVEDYDSDRPASNNDLYTFDRILNEQTGQMIS